MLKMISRLLAAAMCLGAVGCGAAGSSALASQYPTRPVTIVVGFSAGGNADLVARLVAQRLSETLGQPFIVENKGGAGGLLASEAVAKSAPDGYRLLLVTGAFPAQAAALSRLPFDPVRDFTPISVVVSYPAVIVVPATSPFTSLKDLIAYAKAHPGQLNYPSPGTGSLFHLAVELFADKTGISLTHIPFKGGGQQVTELIAGRLDVMFDTLSVVQSQIKSGKLRALAVTSPQRLAQLPDVPTVDEVVGDYEVSSFVGLAGPANLPPDIVARLNTAIDEAVNSPDIKARFIELGGTPLGGTPQQAAETMNQALETWQKIARSKNIKAD